MPRAKRQITRQGPNRQVHVEPAGLKKIETMAANGHPAPDIAASLGCSGEALRMARKRQPEVAEAFERGHAALETELTHILLGHARDGNVTAAIFLAKARLGWRDQGPSPEGGGQRVNVQINMPSAKDPESWRAEVEAEATEVNDD